MSVASSTFCRKASSDANNISSCGAVNSNNIPVTLLAKLYKRE